MPELPEVETIKNELAPHVNGRKIESVTLLWERAVKEISIDEFRSRLTGRTITGLRRRAKYLIFSLDSDYSLIVHLRMTGSLIVTPRSTELPKFTRTVIGLDNGTDIIFRDPRKFGLMRLMKDPQTILEKLGPEPLEPRFTPAVLGAILECRSAPIKATLLDQELIAGIGNMYADEALFEAKIHPEREAGSLTKAEIGRLHKAILKVLKAGIASQGASIENYFRPDGSKGTAHDYFNVAHQRGKNCPVCGTPIKHIFVRQRGTYFCPKCQPRR